MRHIITLCFLFIVTLHVYTQVVITPDPAYIHTDTVGIIDTIKFTITNNGNTEVQFFWTLDHGKNFPTQYRTQICDFNLCYDYNTKQSSPNKPNRLPGNTVNHSFSFYLTDSFNYLFNDTLYLTFFRDKNFSDTLQSIPIRIGEQSGTSSVDDVSLPTSLLYPNPVSDEYFFLESEVDYDGIRIYDMVSRLRAHYPRTSGSKYNIKDLESGFYLISLYDNSKPNAHIQVLKLCVKR